MAMVAPARFGGDTAARPAVAFTPATVGTTLIAVLVLQSGVAALQLPRLNQFAHALAGL